jgi:tetraprenyl-beta-curcumene synthase
LKWWEFAAATGSTLGMFALACAAITPLGPDDASSLVRAYFPSISALHILLDYYIDREEDEVGGDLNFVSYYSTAAEREAALSEFVQRSMDDASSTADAWLHRAVVRGLLAMYLSDPKARVRDLCPEADALVSLGGCPTRFLRDACGVMRKLLRF